MNEHKAAGASRFAATTPNANGGPVRLTNETIVHVAGLMQEAVGASRKYALTLDWFALDHDIMAKDVTARLRLTRITDGILVDGEAQGTALIECVRCLEIYEQPFEAGIEQEYRPTIDVRSGQVVEQPEAPEEFGAIDESHELNLAEALRQEALVSLPMQPICREDCPGLPEATAADDDTGDARLSVLEQLLAEDDATEDQARHE